MLQELADWGIDGFLVSKYLFSKKIEVKNKVSC